MLRLLSYLAPSIPADFFQLVARVIGDRAGVEVSLAFEQRFSGPMPGDENPVAEGAIDIAFMCAPSYRWQRDLLVLLPVPVPADERAAGRPVYFGDIVVRRDARAASIADLRGARWAFNDRNSRSGWFCMVDRIAPAAPNDYFGAVVAAGSHLESLRLIRAGMADAAAIDSNALRLAAQADVSLIGAIRVIETWGPFPIQPVVARRSLPPATLAAVRDALLGAHDAVGAELRDHGFLRFVDASPCDYD